MNNTSCILTVIKNEHEYLDEWIKYHLDLGINHIFIFEDIDSDSHKEICDKYGDKVSLDSILSIFNEEEKSKIKHLKLIKSKNHNDSPQYAYIKKGLLYLKELNEYDWCFVIDNDEFITLENENGDLKNVISLFEEYDAFIMQWKCYGANGLIHKPDYKEKGLIDTYTKEIPGFVPTSTPQSLSKTCYNLKTYQENFFLYTHQPSKDCNFCRTNFERERNKPIYDKIYIRHYITKSWEEYVWKRKTRGYFFGNLRTYDAFFNINSDMIDKKYELIKQLKDEVLVVLSYKQSGSQGNELKLALNGWRKFCKFNYHFVIIGTFSTSLKNEFEWVEFIECPTIDKKEGQYNPHLDVQHCLEIVMNRYDKVYNGFIWIADDNYAVKPFDLKDITSIHFHSSNFNGCEKCPTSFWRHDKWKTRQLLDKYSLPHINYTTHYPCYFDFKKIKEIWDKFNMRKESYVLEDIYFNYFKHEEPILDSTIRLGIWDNNIYKNNFQNAVNNPNIKFMCNSVDGWSKELEKDLERIVKPINTNIKTSIFTVIKNEHEYLDEWIKYHLDLGIDHIFVFEDMDSESHKEIIDKYGDKVTLGKAIDIINGTRREEALKSKNNGSSPQKIYVTDGLVYIREHYDYDWCFALDCDEYITLENDGDTIKNVLGEFDGYDAVILQWKNYGANGLIHKPDYKEKGIIDTYTKPCENADIGINMTKTCYNMRTYITRHYLTNHQPSDKCKWCRTDFSVRRANPVYDKMYLRHYITKSWEEYVHKLKIRGMFCKEHRNYDDFFKMNTDMLDRKEELLGMVDELTIDNNYN